MEKHLGLDSRVRTDIGGRVFLTLEWDSDFLTDSFIKYCTVVQNSKLKCPEISKYSCFVLQQLEPIKLHHVGQSSG
jgi:hypothetical protein